MAFGGPYPGETGGRWVDRDTLEETFLQRTAFMRETGTPIWVGEFGPVYTGDPERDEMRYQVLSDQLEIYDRHAAGWSLWTYKDVGLQGLVTVDPESPYMAPLRRPDREEGPPGRGLLGLDRRRVARALRAAARARRERVPGVGAVPVERALDHRRLVRHLLLAQAMLPEYAERFRGLDDDELDALADSFRLASCVPRARLAAVLRERRGQGVATRRQHSVDLS